MGEKGRVKSGERVKKHIPEVIRVINNRDLEGQIAQKLKKIIWTMIKNVEIGSERGDTMMNLDGSIFREVGMRRMKSSGSGEL